MNSQAKKIWISFAPSIILITALIFIWEIYTGAEFINPNILPQPSHIILSMIKNWHTLAPHVYQTAVETLIGFMIAIVLGGGVALVIDSSSILRRMIYPVLVASQTIPIIALAPLFLIWFGFGIAPKIIMVVLICFFPITLATASGLARADIDQLRLLYSMNAARWQIIKMIKIPNALPSFFAGAKIAAAYSVTGAIIGELVGAQKGLGIYMKLMANSKATVNVFAAIFITITLSLLLFFIVILIEKISTPWSND